MNLSYTPEYEDYRLKVRAFLEAAWPKSLTREERKAGTQAFRRMAVEAGYLYRHVPEEYGGAGQAPDVLKGQIIREEFERARAPMEIVHPGVNMLAPTLLEWGTAAQKEAFVRKTILGEIKWAQGYSEPGAGSDLASLRTRGELKGDEWVINGQKVWSSFAAEADYTFALVRTEPDAPKHKGISYLLIDLRQPGVTVRPLRQITGQSEFCEVFFEDARTPADWIVGPRGEGWMVSKSTLKFERSSIGGADRTRKRFDRLIALAREVQIDGGPAIAHPRIRSELARIDGAMTTLQYSSYRQLSMNARGESAGIVEMMFKLYATNIGHAMAALARELMGDRFMLISPDEGDRGAFGAEKWNHQYLGSLGIAIAGGASNIQRNIIAERGLGLPRDPTAGAAA